MPAGTLVGPEGSEWLVLALLALLVGGLVLCCLISCFLPDELGALLGTRARKSDKKKKPN